MPRKKLTHQQSKFVEAMANPKTKNQTQAAIAAGCPKKSARVQASKWLTNPNISEAVERRKKRALAHCLITPEEVIGSAAFNMRSSIDDVLDESGSFSLEKARATGAIDIVKKLKATVITNKEGDTKQVLEVELQSPADARKEVAHYIGLTQHPIKPVENAVHKWKRAVITLMDKKVVESAAEAIALYKEVGCYPPNEQVEQELIREMEGFLITGASENV